MVRRLDAQKEFKALEPWLLPFQSPWDVVGFALFLLTNITVAVSYLHLPIGMAVCIALLVPVAAGRSGRISRRAPGRRPR